MKNAHLTVKSTIGEMENKIDSLFKFKDKKSSVRVIFRIYEEIDKTTHYESYSMTPVRIPDFHSIFVRGNVRFTCGRYTSELYLNPTWIDVIWEANEAIMKNGQVNYIFLESVDFDSNKFGDKYYKFLFGS